MVMRTLYQHVENNHERAYCNMMDDSEMQDAKKEWIESRAEELIRNFANGNDWQLNYWNVVDLMKISDTGR